MSVETCFVWPQVDLGKLALKALVVRWRKCTTTESELEDVEFDITNAIGAAKSAVNQAGGDVAKTVQEEGQKAINKVTKGFTGGVGSGSEGCGMEAVLQIRAPDISLDISAVGASLGLKRFLVTASTDGHLEV